MTRVAVIGNGGGGKTTMCRRLSCALNIPFYPIDQIQFKPGWQPATHEEFREKHEQILAREKWIIDGWGPREDILRRFELADTLIFVDHPLSIHYWWAAKRQFLSIFRGYPDGPEGCELLPVTRRMFQTIHRVHYKLRPWLIEALAAFEGRKDIVHIHSPGELRRFLKQHGAA
ncbi:MAG TPA: hypothetical protein VF458_06000 [Ktedonobacteraceae bacterium]